MTQSGSAAACPPPPRAVRVIPAVRASGLKPPVAPPSLTTTCRDMPACECVRSGSRAVCLFQESPDDMHSTCGPDGRKLLHGMTYRILTDTCGALNMVTVM